MSDTLHSYLVWEYNMTLFYFRLVKYSLSLSFFHLSFPKTNYAEAYCILMIRTHRNYDELNKYDSICELMRIWTRVSRGKAQWYLPPLLIPPWTIVFPKAFDEDLHCHMSSFLCSTSVCKNIDCFGWKFQARILYKSVWKFKLWIPRRFGSDWLLFFFFLHV